MHRAWYNVDIPFTDYQFDPSVAGIKTAANVVTDTAASGLHWIVDQIEGLVGSGVSWLGERWASLREFASMALEGARSAFGNILGFIKNPLASLGDALMSLDAQAIARAWAGFSGLVSSLANGFKAMTEGVLTQVGAIWSGIDSFARGLLSRVAGLTDNFLFKKLPDALQNVAFAMIDRLKRLWKGIHDGWEKILKGARDWIDTAVDKVFSFVQRVLSFGINAVVAGIVQFGQVVLFLKDLFANPRKYVELMARRSVQAFDGVKSRFAGVAGQYFGGGARAVPAAATGATGPVVHRAPDAAAVHRSASWNEVGHGVSQTMGKKWDEFRANPMDIVTKLLVDMVLPVIGNITDVVQLFKDIKKIVTGPLSASSLDEFWTSLLQILDIPILIYNTVISILMRSLMVPLIVATFIPHPMVKGIAAMVGYALLGGFVQGQVMNLEHKLVLLKTASTVQSQKDDAYNSVADSLIALAMAAVITVVMLILHFIANVMKGIYGFVKGRVFKIGAPPLALGEGGAGAEAPKQLPPGPDAPKQLPSGPEPPKQLPPGPDAPKQLPAGPETPKQLPPGPDAPQPLPANPETPKQLPPGPEVPKELPPGPEEPKKSPSGPEPKQPDPETPKPPKTPEQLAAEKKISEVQADRATTQAELEDLQKRTRDLRSQIERAESDRQAASREFDRAKTAQEKQQAVEKMREAVARREAARARLEQTPSDDSLKREIARQDREIDAEIRKLNPQGGRDPIDVAREQENPVPPKPDESGTISESPTQDAELRKDVASAKAQNAKDIRVNQEQVNAKGRRVGQNRPDLQYTLPDGARVYIEYDTVSSKRGPEHEARIKANDPSAKVILKILD